MARVRVVSAYVPLEVKHLTSEKYHEYAHRMADAIPDNYYFFDPYPIEQCWLWKWFASMPQEDDGPAIALPPPCTEVPADRYATPRHMTLSNIVQHERTSWMRQCAVQDPEAEVLVWLDFAILKQGDWTGKPVTEQIIKDFVKRIEDACPLDCIPFPGIWGPDCEIKPREANWRFCGSTHIIPRKLLGQVDYAYKIECMEICEQEQAVPLDLPVWAKVERNWGLPFRFYQANHDATQLTEYHPWPEV